MLIGRVVGVLRGKNKKCIWALPTPLTLKKKKSMLIGISDFQFNVILLDALSNSGENL